MRFLAVTNRSSGPMNDTTSNVKVLTDNGGRFKVHHHNKDEVSEILYFCIN